MRKVLFLLLALFALRTLVSCCYEKGYWFQWGELQVENLNVSMEPPALLTSDTVTAEEFGLRLRFEEERISYHRLGGLSMSEAIAYTCEASFQNKDTITSILITSRNALDSLRPAGSQVEDHFVARPSRYENYNPQYQYAPLRESLELLNREQNYALDLRSLDLKFKDVHPKQGPHMFIVSVTFKSGRVLSDSSAVVLK